MADQARNPPHDDPENPQRRALLLAAGGAAAVSWLGALEGCANGPPIPENQAPPVESRYIAPAQGASGVAFSSSSKANSILTR